MPYGMPAQGSVLPYNPNQPSGGSDGAGVASLVLGILWFGGLGSVLAVIFGHISRSQAGKAFRPKSGLSLAGLILGYVGIAGAALFYLVIISAATAVVHVQNSLAHDAQTKSDIRNLATAEETYYTDNDSYTTSISTLDSGGFGPSSETTHVTLTLAGSGADATYCIAGTSPSGTTYYYSSAKAFLGVSTVACP